MPSTERVAKVVLVDIEGTTTSIGFVHDILFPYAKNNVEKFLEDSWDSSVEIKEIVRQLQQVPQFAEYTALVACSSNGCGCAGDGAESAPGPNLAAASGELMDVPGAFAAWREAGLRIAVYSSGSVAAQKLIFKHSVVGDLLTHLSAHFDTHVGHKQETQSYANIAKTLGEDPRHILFLTDTPGEAAAARSAGLQTIVLQRPGNAPLTDDQKSRHELIADFSSLHTLQLPE